MAMVLPIQLVCDQKHGCKYQSSLSTWILIGDGDVH